MHRRSRIPLVLGIVAMLGALAATTALATSVKRFDSKVTLAKKNPFHGRVKSPKHACEVRRKVKVFNKQPGPDGLYGTTKTNKKGKWSIPASPNGKFYAKVTRRKKSRARTILVCRPDTSPRREFGA